MNKHAYLIMAYNDFYLLNILLKQIDSEKNDIYLHIDKKSKELNTEMFFNICKKSKLYIFKEYKIYWGDFSQTECELFLLRKANENMNYSYFHLLSGSDLLLKNSNEVYDFFEESKKEFIHFESKEMNKNKVEWINKFYIFQKFLRISRHKWINKCFKILEIFSIKLQRILKINRKSLYKQYLTGANWFSITNDLVKYILENEKSIQKQYNFTKSSDEIFLQTLVYNSKFVNNLYNSNFDNDYSACMRYIDWNRGMPYVFMENDFEELIASNMLFARKITTSESGNLINKIFERTNNE